MNKKLRELLKSNLDNYDQIDISHPSGDKMTETPLRVQNEYSFAGVLCDLYSKEFGEEWDIDLNSWVIFSDWGTFLNKTFSCPSEVVLWSGIPKKDIDRFNSMSFEDIKCEI
tara:strand:- start:103 stop:438 length:336 start_codon:yes stop_codon:yes gene_type:complete